VPYTNGQHLGGSLEPKTIGDHLRKKRLASKMFQNDLAKKLGVSVAGYRNWECNATTPEVRYMLAIIEFIGCNPLPEGTSWGDRLVHCRTSHGLTQKEAADEIGVDQGTLAKWQQGKREPTGDFLKRVTRFLDCAKGKESQSRRAG
jgi:transcriptional regulator with XRE-family HTH domain